MAAMEVWARKKAQEESRAAEKVKAAAAAAAEKAAAFVPEKFHVPGLGSPSYVVWSQPTTGGECRFGCGAMEDDPSSAHQPSCPNGRGQ